MKLHVDKETKRIKGYTIIGNPVDETCDFIEIDMPQEEITEDLMFSKYIDGEIILDEEMKATTQEAVLLNELRAQREIECFPIINRGALWYNTLTEEQEAELQVWYQAWLDVTETKVIPEKPEWLV